MSLSDTEQRDLLRRFKQGDNKAFDDLYASIEERVLRYIVSHTRETQDAQQIAQHTRDHVFQTEIYKYDPDRSRLLPYVKRSARVMMARYYRESGQQDKVALLLKQFQAEAEQHTLIERFQRGDRSAFDGLHASIEKRVLGYIRNRTQDKETEEEVAQNTWERVMESNLSTYDPDCAPLDSYVIGVARNRLLRYYYENRQRREIILLLARIFHKKAQTSCKSLIE